MTKELESRKDLVNENATRHDENRNDNPPTLTLPLRWGGNLDGNSSTPQSLINDKGLFAYLPIRLFALKHAAFTLAEVLITLAVIGIVAAMTIPSLISDYKVKTTVTTLKKFQSTMAQAVLMAEIENGSATTWGMKKDEKESAELIAKKILPYLKVIDDCGTDVCEGYTKDWKYLSGKNWSVVTNFGLDFYYKARLADGSEIFIRPNGVDLSIFIDLNGKKEPNTLGKDIFRVVSKDGKTDFLYYGVPDEDWIISEGWFAGAWIVTFENMDYLKCPNELSWDGKHKCSD